MNSPFLRKLLGVTVLLIVIALVIIWLAIDLFAADYFSFLMEKYNVPKQEAQQMFLDAAHRYLLSAGFVSLSLAVGLGFFLTRKALHPLYQMMLATRQIAQGDYAARAPINLPDEFGQLAAEFNHMADSLQRIEQLRKTMVVDVAHELRIPLTNICGYLEALRDGVLEPAPKLFESLHEEALRLAHLAEALLQLSSADAGRSVLYLQPVDLQQLIAQSLELFRVQFAAKEITVTTQFRDGAPPATADPEKLAQVVSNLLQNAWQYTPPGGRVRVTVEFIPGAVRAIFANTGDGIAAPDLPFIFERFYRGEKSRSRELGGAGIGLAIVKGLIEAHGGQVKAESVAGETRISFLLPV